jgi:dTDP-4-amino-4,6-dideoxygalactose transaminase
MGGRCVDAATHALAKSIGLEPGQCVLGSTGTLSFESLLVASGLRPGDEVAIPAYGWVSVASSIRACGAIPRVADVGMCRLHPTVRDFENVITPVTRAVVVTHMRGYAHPEILELSRYCRGHGIYLIEDCAQAWGTRIHGQHVGTFGDFAFFSMQQNKVLSTGEGGLAIARDGHAAELIRELHGYTMSASVYDTGSRNFRMSEISASALLPQIPRLPRLVAGLRKTLSIAAEYLDERVPGTLLMPHEDVEYSNGICLPLRCQDHATAERLRTALSGVGIAAYRPAETGDMHQANAWGLGQLSLPGLESLRSYVDVPIPCMTSARRRRWVRDLFQTMEASSC